MSRVHSFKAGKLTVTGSIWNKMKYFVEKVNFNFLPMLGTHLEAICIAAI